MERERSRLKMADDGLTGGDSTGIIDKNRVRIKKVYKYFGKEKKVFNFAAP
jgi:hypothetical protein